MKKKTVSIMVAATMALSLFAGCGSSKDTATEDTGKTESTETTDESSENASAETTDESSRTTFTVGFDAEYPPYGYMDDDGEYTGFDLELAQAVCDKEGWELVKKPINWDSKDMELNSGSIDCIWNGFTMNGREDDYTFSVPYVDNSQVIVVAENSGIEQLSDLAGKTVGVQAASAALDLLQSEDEGGQMTAGFGQTCLIFFLTLIFSLPLGMIVYFGRVCRFKPLSWLVKIYISIMRGTPLMLQLLIWYFGPFYLWGMNIGGYKFTAIILGCSLNYAAYFAEIYRSGIESIPTGQYEAAQLLGYTRVQTFFKIVLPQVVKIVLPSVTNEVITLVKDTSLVYSVSYIEMFAVAKQIAAAQTTVVPFFIAGIFYYVFNYVVAWMMELFEKKLNYYR